MDSRVKNLQYRIRSVITVNTNSNTYCNELKESDKSKAKSNTDPSIVATPFISDEGYKGGWVGRS